MLAWLEGIPFSWQSPQSSKLLNDSCSFPEFRCDLSEKKTFLHLLPLKRIIQINTANRYNLAHPPNDVLLPTDTDPTENQLCEKGVIYQLLGVAPCGSRPNKLYHARQRIEQEWDCCFHQHGHLTMTQSVQTATSLRLCLSSHWPDTGAGSWGKGALLPHGSTSPAVATQSA